MAFVLGLNHKLYFQTTGTRATWPGTGAAPNLTEVTKAMDLSFNGDAATAEASTRGGGSFRQKVATLKDASLEFDLVYDTSDTMVVQAKDKWLSGGVFGVAVLNGASATVGTQGIWMDGVVTGFEWNQELEEVGKVAVTIENALSDVPLEWVTVA